MDRVKKGIVRSLRVLGAMIARDLKAEVRQATDIVAILVFDIVLVFIFSLTYTIGINASNMPIGIYIIQVWVILIFSLLFIISKTFIREKETGTLNGLLTAPVTPGLIVASKVVMTFILLCIIEIVVFGFSIIVSRPTGATINGDGFFYFILVGLLLPTIDIAACGTLISAFSMYAKHRSFILPVLIFPLIAPIISPLVSINVNLLQGAPISTVIFDLLFILFHVIFLASTISLASRALLIN